MSYTLSANGYRVQVNGVSCIRRLCGCSQKSFSLWANCRIFSQFKEWKSLVQRVHTICSENLEPVGVTDTLHKLVTNLATYDFNLGHRVELKPHEFSWERDRKLNGGCVIQETLELRIFDADYTTITFRVRKLGPMSLQLQTAHALARALFMSQPRAKHCPNLNLLPVPKLLHQMVIEAWDLESSQCCGPCAGWIKYFAFAPLSEKDMLAWVDKSMLGGFSAITQSPSGRCFSAEEHYIEET